MRYLRSVLPAIVLSFIFGAAFAQTEPTYSQYIMNGFLINPSFAGRDGYTTVNLTVREQWVGLSGAPSTYAASFQTRILKNSFISKSTAVRKKIVKPTKGGKVGLGGYIFNDNNGIMKRTGFLLAYSYHIPMGRTGGIPNDLSFGLALKAYQFYVNTDHPILDNSYDPVLNSYDQTKYYPDFNFGASFTTSKYYVGFAMTNMLRGSLVFADTSSINGIKTKGRELGGYYLTGGYKFPLSPDWIFEPSAFIKASDMFFTSVQMDLTARMYYKEDYWAGFSYRTNDAIVALMGLKYERFYFSYAFDFTLTDIRKQSFGTHEFSVAVKFGESARRYRWINAY
jgi:type IX secretion system PorP/SprF family membrane protein